MRSDTFFMTNKKRGWQLLAGASAIVLILAMFLAFSIQNRKRILEQNAHYLQDSAAQMASQIDETLTETLHTLKTMAYIYEKNMTSAEVTLEDMQALAENSTFNYVEFTSKDGTSYRSDGLTRDASSEEYYLSGIQEQSGLVITSDISEDSQSYITFYTPLHYHGESIGILRGICSIPEQIQPLLNLSFWGEDASVFLCGKDGSVIVGNHTRDLPKNILNFLQPIVQGSSYDSILSSLDKGQETSFTFSGRSGISDGYIKKLENYDWFLVQFLPSSVTQSMMHEAMQAGVILEISLIAIFVLYILLILFQNFKQRNELLKENQEQNCIIQGIPELFDGFVLIDLEEETYRFLLGTTSSLGEIEPEGNYSAFARHLTETLGEESEADFLRKILSIPELQKNLSHDLPLQYEFQIRNNKDRWFYLNIICLSQKDGVPYKVLFTKQDISEVKQEEIRNHAALQEAFHAAESANFAKREFLSRVSHDIRTPMNAIMGMTSIAALHLNEPERIRDCLNKITTSSKHLLGLINDVLDMSKIESGKITLNEDEFNLSDVIDDLLTMFRGQIQAKGQFLQVDIPELEHTELIGDSHRLSQILVNIMGNAVKFTPSGGTISLAVREKKSRIHQYVSYEFIIRDTGIGMEPEFIKRIFEPFARAEDSRISKTEGTGLGMPIAKNIANMMNGDIRIQSTPNVGSEVTVVVMLQPRETQEANLEALAGIRVLIVDDDEITCENASDILTNIGMEPEWVLSGEEAVERLAEEDHNFSILVMDWKMPGMDGLETTKEIRRKYGDHLPIIILSAYDWGEIETEAREVGVNAFISKPLFKTRLVHVMSSLLIKEPPADTAEIEQQETNICSGKKVLLVEDIELNSEIAVEILKTIDMEATPVYNGEEAVQELLSKPAGTYDVVLMDIQMPKMNGYEATEAIRASEREDLKTLPIIAMTANAFTEDIQKSFASGMNGHIAKPIEIGKLMSALDKCLRESLAAEEKAEGEREADA